VTLDLLGGNNFLGIALWNVALEKRLNSHVWKVGWLVDDASAIFLHLLPQLTLIIGRLFWKARLFLEVSRAILMAKETIYIHNWWLSPGASLPSSVHFTGCIRAAVTMTKWSQVSFGPFTKALGQRFKKALRSSLLFSKYLRRANVAEWPIFVYSDEVSSRTTPMDSEWAPLHVFSVRVLIRYIRPFFSVMLNNVW
jgi:hypothetical protein